MARVLRARKDKEGDNVVVPPVDVAALGAPFPGLDKGNLAPFEFGFKALEEVDFGAFVVARGENGMMFRNHLGYHVFTAPYTADIEGEVKPNSLYAWLDNLLGLKKAVEGHEDEPFIQGDTVTRGEMLETAAIMTVANLTKPMTAFVDMEEARLESDRYIRWLSDKMAKLGEAMAELKPEDLAAAERDRVRRDMEDEAARVFMEGV